MFEILENPKRCKEVKKALKPKSITLIPSRLILLQKITKFPKSLILEIKPNFSLTILIYCSDYLKKI